MVKNKCKHCGDTHTFVGNDAMGYYIYCSNVDCISNGLGTATINKSRLPEAYQAWDEYNEKKQINLNGD